MSEYKGIKGFQVQTRETDPSDPIIGDFYYNSSEGKFKNIASGAGSGTWASGGNLNTAGYRIQGGAGIQTAGLMVGRASPNKANVESYDGSSWTEVADVSSAAADAANCTVVAACTRSTVLTMLSICMQEDLQTMFAMLKQFLIC